MNLLFLKRTFSYGKFITSAFMMVSNNTYKIFRTSQ